MSPAPRVLADRYELGQLLGTGGMARVHRGRDRVLERDVAIKVLQPGSASDRRFIRLFMREARAAAGLTHPHVVTVFDTGVHGEEHFIVMELVEGETLRDLLAREGPLDPEDARRLAAGIAAALAAAHEGGLVHRDVKPGNVLIDRHGEPKVADFGIARAVEDEEETRGVVLGTASTMSPEQAEGRPTDAASDVYSLGCVLYEMLAGRPPFEGDHPLAVAARHLHEAPVPVETLRPEVPSELADIVGRSLRKQPAERFRNGSEMLAALEAVGAAELPPTPATRSPRRLRFWAAAAAVLALLVAVAPVLFRGSSGAPDRARAVDARTVRVPDVVGLSEDEAARRMREAGLLPRLRGGALDDGVAGVVVGQDPEPGDRVERESTVTLEVDVPGEGSPDEGEAKETEKPENDASGEGSGSVEGDDTSAEASPSPPPSPTPTQASSPSPSPSPTTSPVSSDG